MKNCSLLMNGVYQDELFNLGSNLNRDNGFNSWVILRDTFSKHQISLHTADVNHNKDVAFELHVDSQTINTAVTCYLLMLETPQVWPANGVDENLERYSKIFTWNDTLVGTKQFVKANFPNLLSVHPVDGYANRDRFCCLISANKMLPTQDKRTLYPERVKVIRWFQKHAPQDFDLYGVDWDMPVNTSGLHGKLLRLFWRGLSSLVALHPFPSYRGRVKHKYEVLQRTRFSFCYENIRDIPGYITEKIFDSFFSGCVPVYWGANNISDYIPADCFIDRRQFDNTAAVYRYLKNMTEEEFRGYQLRIATYLQSDAAYLFSAEAMAETIVNTIVNDIGT
jgi:hypothetical protein